LLVLDGIQEVSVQFFENKIKNTWEKKKKNLNIKTGESKTAFNC